MKEERRKEREAEIKIRRRESKQGLKEVGELKNMGNPKGKGANREKKGRGVYPLV